MGKISGHNSKINTQYRIWASKIQRMSYLLQVATQKLASFFMNICKDRKSQQL